MRRRYRSLLTNITWQKLIPAILVSEKPLYFISIETTGLDPAKDRIIGIVVAKTEFTENRFVLKEIKRLLVNPQKYIPPFITEINGISNEMVKDAPTIGETFHQINDFMGENAYVAAFSAMEFVMPFLCEEEKRSRVRLSMANEYIDLYEMALGLVGKSKITDRMNLNEICNRCNIVSTGIEQKIDLFNLMFTRMPLGNEKAKVRRTTYWEKAYDRRYIYIETDYGRIRLDCVTGFFEEETQGIFDVIDLDYLTDFIYEKMNVVSIFEFIKLYDAKSKFVKRG